MKGPIALLSLGIILVSGSLGYEFLLASNNSETPIAQQTVLAPVQPTPPSKTSTRDILSYAPADTLLFLGGLEPSRFQDMLKVSMPDAGGPQMEWPMFGETENTDPPPPPAAAFVEGILVEYMKAIKTPETAAKSLGIKENVEGIVYTVGAIPVVRFSLASNRDFLAFLDRAENISKVSHKKYSFHDLALRGYAMETGKGEDEKALELIVTVQNDYGVITIALPEHNRDALLEHALGIKKPSASLADTKILQNLRDKYDFHPSYLGYIDHTILIEGLTQPNKNQFGRMIDGFIKANSKTHNTSDVEPSPSKEHPLASIQTPACQRELSSIVNTWPRSVMGYTKLDIKKHPMAFQAIALLEVNDQELLNSLKTLRGYIPPHLRGPSNDTLFGFGLGFNMDALLPFLTKTVQDILQTPYECAPLKDIKQKLATSNGMAAIGMASGMLAGLQGISASIFNIDGSIDLASKKPNIKAVDAMLTLSASNPQSFIMMAANFVPPLASLQIPNDGTAVNLPLPLPIPLTDTPKIAIKGKHIVAYIGKEARKQAEKLDTSALEQHALLAFNIDHGQYLELLSTVAEENKNSTNKKQVTKPLIQKPSSKTHMNQIMDISKHGISMESNVTVN